MTVIRVEHQLYIMDISRLLLSVVSDADSNSPPSYATLVYLIFKQLLRIDTLQKVNQNNNQVNLQRPHWLIILMMMIYILGFRYR